MSHETSPFPAVHSVLSPGALAEVLRRDYGGSPGVAVRLLRRNINDTYLVTGLEEHARAILRVYRTAWRSAAEVAWELSLIGHAAAAGVAVSRPILRRDGRWFGILPAIEGPRVYALFGYAAGRPPEPTETDGAVYGRAAAALHTATDGFEAGGRSPLDLGHLIGQPLEAIRPLLDDAPALLRDLEAAANRTHARLSALVPALSWGACHGDLHGGNARVGEDGAVILFDFDCGGPGPRAYDLAVYGWSLASNEAGGQEAERVWDAFLEAYQERRPLSGPDRQALPLFVVARSLWFMGLMAGRVGEFGSETLDREFFEYGLDFLRGWEEKHLG